MPRKRIRSGGNRIPPGRFRLSLEQLENRLLLSTVGSAQAAQTSYPPPAQAAQTSYSAPAPALSGPMTNSSSPYKTSPAASNTAYTDSSSSPNTKDTDSSDEYKTSSTTASAPSATNSASTPRVDVPLLVAAQNALPTGALPAQSSPLPVPANALRALPAGQQSVATLGQSPAPVAVTQGQQELPRAVPRAPDAAVPDASGRPEQEELEVIDSLFAPEAAAGPLPEPQDIKALAGIMLPDLRALEEGVSALLGRIDAAGHEWAGSVLGKSLGPWLASGLVAAAAFELALWRVTRNSARTLFITQRREDSTWTWFPGRAQPPWLGNP